MCVCVGVGAYIRIYIYIFMYIYIYTYIWVRGGLVEHHLVDRPTGRLVDCQEPPDVAPDRLG